MTKIYLIRHAQAEGNVYRMMQGHWDGGVTRLGRRQIDFLAERFRGETIDAVYASDLYRTRLTASAITRYHTLPLRTDPALREINVGPWETLFFANLKHDEPEAIENFIHDPERFRVEGAETYAQVTERAYAALGRIARAHEGQTVAVVSHGVTIRCLLSKITGIPLSDTERLPINRNTAVSAVVWEDGRFTSVSMNDYSHLAPLGEISWSRTADLRHEPLDPTADRAFYTDCYRDAWQAAHGDLKGYFADLYYLAAVEHYRDDPGAVLRILREEESVGLVDMDTRRGAHAGYGWVSLLYLRPEYRNQGYGAQLLARALFHYRELGRAAVRLHVSEENAPALAFYEKEGFRRIGAEAGSAGRMLLLEKKLGGPEE